MNSQNLEKIIEKNGEKILSKAVILTTGTYLKGKVIIGEYSYSSGPDGHFPANALSGCLADLGFTIIRLKTGTPPRVNRQSVDFSKTEPQMGDDLPFSFSFDEDAPKNDQLPCYLTHTNQKTHDIPMRLVGPSKAWR